MSTALRYQVRGLNAKLQAQELVVARAQGERGEMAEALHNKEQTLDRIHRANESHLLTQLEEVWIVSPL